MISIVPLYFPTSKIFSPNSLPYGNYDTFTFGSNYPKDISGKSKG